jgi:hypothetical protein
VNESACTDRCRDRIRQPQIDDPHRFVATVLEFLQETEPSCLTPESWSELLRDAPLTAQDPATYERERAEK